MGDEQLAALCRQGDRRALEQLVERYYQPVKKYYLKLSGDPALSEDLTHDAMLKLIRGIDKFNPRFGAKFSTWVFTIAHNTYLNHIQRNPASKEVILDESLSSPDDSARVDVQAEKNIAARMLKRHLDELPPELKAMVILRYYSGFSYAEIARILGSNAGKVKWKLHSALEKLKRAMSAWEGGI